MLRFGRILTAILAVINLERWRQRRAQRRARRSWRRGVEAYQVCWRYPAIREAVASWTPLQWEQYAQECGAGDWRAFRAGWYSEAAA